jgi:hypothetical protein
LHILWPLVATLAKTKSIWTDEENIALWSTERVLLRKRLAAVYLRYRTDEEIARFVARHYLPFRIGLSRRPEKTEKAALDSEKVMIRLRSLETTRERFPHLNPFAIAILAFQGTSIPTTTLLIDMIYHLYHLGRPLDIVGMLQGLSVYSIRPSRSDITQIIRLLTKPYPESALNLLRLYPDVQYSTFAHFIASTASRNPELAISAYRLLTPPFVHRLSDSTSRPCPPGRRLPKRRLLTAMAWKFANSPMLSPRQCFRYVQKCFQTMMMLKLPPGPRVGLAIAVAGIERAIQAGIPLKSEWPRVRWILWSIKRTSGMKREKEADVMVRSWEIKMRRGKRFLSILPK